MADLAPHRPCWRPVPESVVELCGLPVDGGIVARQDGSLLMVHLADAPSGLARRVSADGGRSWSAAEPLRDTHFDGAQACGLVRLQSGELALYHGTPKAGWRLSLSADDGDSWALAGTITTFPYYFPMYHSLIELASGRLLVCGYWQTQEPVLGLERLGSTGWGWWRGKVLYMEGHRAASVGFCFTYVSDDKGRTWKQSPDELIRGIFGWFDAHGELNGAGGIVDLYEPTAAETADGRVLLLARSKTGRLVQSYSNDGGLTWYPAEPTELASSQSPPLLVRIPSTGDLLCVWNQVSGEEIRRGFLRGRLSAAISADCGLTWQHFRTLELQAGMEDRARIEPEFPIPRSLVGRSPFGRLPDGFAMFTYPNVDLVGDHVFVRYLRGWPEPVAESGDRRAPRGAPRMWPEYEEREAQIVFETVLRRYPLRWFYADE